VKKNSFSFLFTSFVLKRQVYFWLYHRIIAVFITFFRKLVDWVGDGGGGLVPGADLQHPPVLPLQAGEPPLLRLQPVLPGNQIQLNNGFATKQHTI
jgi:hypothetical protein